MFESGTLTGGPAINVALLTASLNYIKSLGVANIQAHRQPLIKRSCSRKCRGSASRP